MEELRRLFAFNRWANQRMLDAASELTAEELTRDMRSSFPSVLDTLVHMVGAEWVWLARWTGESPREFPDASGLTSLQAVRDRWDDVWGGQQGLLASLSGADDARHLRYRLFSGAEDEQPLGDLMRHVINHGTYHRGQLVTLLRQLGRTPPSTDYLRYLRETGG
jgi:uncharacterized damage-inducible protein DinB